MINAIRDIGAYQIAKNHLDKLDVLVNSINYQQSLFVYFIETTSEGECTGITLEEIPNDFEKDYLFRKIASRGPFVSPSAYLTDAKKTVPNKIMGWFRSALKKNKSVTCPEKHKAFIASFYQKFQDYQEKIVEYIKKNPVPKDASAIVALRVDGQPLISHQVFLDTFLETTTARADKFLEKNELHCSLCGEKKKIFGRADAYTFYTVDKPGFLRGGLTEEREWKNYPVCDSCRLALIQGRKFIESHLEFYFSGLSYYLIPQFMITDPDQQSEVMDILSQDIDKAFKANEMGEASLLTADEDILYYLSQQQDTMTVTILFLLKSNSAERIKSYIPGVFPSRLKQIFSAQNKTRQVMDKDDFVVGKAIFDYADGYETFLSLIQAIFLNQPVNKRIFLSNIMIKIREAFHNKNHAYYAIQDALTLNYFIELLGLFHLSEKLEDITMPETPYDDIFQKYQLQLDTPEKKGVLILGALTQKLLNIQYRERGSQPFYNDLKGLKMNPSDIKSLLPKIINKLNEYEHFHKRHKRLAETAADLLLSSKNQWSMTIDELNFYFSCGMLLSIKFEPYETEE